MMKVMVHAAWWTFDDGDYTGGDSDGSDGNSDGNSAYRMMVIRIVVIMTMVVMVYMVRIFQWMQDDGDNYDIGDNSDDGDGNKLYHIIRTVFVNLFHLRGFCLQAFGNLSHMLFHSLHYIRHIFRFCFIFN